MRRWKRRRYTGCERICAVNSDAVSARIQRCCAGMYGGSTKQRLYAALECDHGASSCDRRIQWNDLRSTGIVAGPRANYDVRYKSRRPAVVLEGTCVACAGRCVDRKYAAALYHVYRDERCRRIHRIPCVLDCGSIECNRAVLSRRTRKRSLDDNRGSCKRQSGEVPTESSGVEHRRRFVRLFPFIYGKCCTVDRTELVSRWSADVVAVEWTNADIIAEPEFYGDARRNADAGEHGNDNADAGCDAVEHTDASADAYTVDDAVTDAVPFDYTVAHTDARFRHIASAEYVEHRYASERAIRSIDVICQRHIPAYRRQLVGSSDFRNVRKSCDDLEQRCERYREGFKWITDRSERSDYLEFATRRHRVQRRNDRSGHNYCVSEHRGNQCDQNVYSNDSTDRVRWTEIERVSGDRPVCDKRNRFEFHVYRDASRLHVSV